MAGHRPAATASMTSAHRSRAAQFSRLAGCTAAALLALMPGTLAHAASNKVRITGLSDIAFGTLSNFAADTVQSQSICLFADTNSNSYNITAMGTGPGGAFQLSSGTSQLPFEVQWSTSAGQNSGTDLNPNMPLAGQTSTASHQACSNGPAASASLIILLRSPVVSSAAAGTYAGALTLLVGPE